MYSSLEWSWPFGKSQRREEEAVEEEDTVVAAMLEVLAAEVVEEDLAEEEVALAAEEVALGAEEEVLAEVLALEAVPEEEVSEEDHHPVASEVHVLTGDIATVDTVEDSLEAMPATLECILCQCPIPTRRATTAAIATTTVHTTPADVVRLWMVYYTNYIQHFLVTKIM